MFKQLLASTALAIALIVSPAIAQDNDPLEEPGVSGFAPGHQKEDGEPAREYAPGYQKEEGESARDYTPRQQRLDAEAEAENNNNVNNNN